MKELRVEVPEGYEIDKENSTFECIKFKPKGIKTWNDLCAASLNSNEVRVSGYRIWDSYSNIYVTNKLIASDYSRDVFLTEKEAKSALAMAQISQLMPYYGGAITDAEWKDCCMRKFVITRSEYGAHFVESVFVGSVCLFHFLAFHTKEQRDSFYKNNEQLVKDYLMID